MRGWLLFVCALATTTAYAETLTVSAADNIYGAGQDSAPGGGNPPHGLSFGKASCIEISHISGSLSCSSPNGCIEINDGDGDTPNDPDGVYAAPPTSSNTGTSLISGITAPYAGYLVGVFLTKAGPSGPAPAALDFTSGEGTGFNSLLPVLDQTFFIGDGLTADGTGAKQTFIVPRGAHHLYLGISYACNYNGAPGCYGDNIGSFTVKVHVYRGGCP